MMSGSSSGICCVEVSPYRKTVLSCSSNASSACAHACSRNRNQHSQQQRSVSTAACCYRRVGKISLVDSVAVREYIKALRCPRGGARRPVNNTEARPRAL
eukprot:9504140-Pyramimonas_sp.AAC.3